MLKSFRRLTLPVISATLFVPLAGAPSSAQVSTEFAARPGHATERITPERANVVSTSHYWSRLVLSCNGSTLCEGNFPAVGSRRRLKLTRISCSMSTATYSKFAVGHLDLLSNGTSYGLFQVLPVDYTTDFGFHSLNRAVDVQVAARQQVRIKLFVASGGQANEGMCTAHGTLEVLG